MRRGGRGACTSAAKRSRIEPTLFDESSGVSRDPTHGPSQQLPRCPPRASPIRRCESRLPAELATRWGRPRWDCEAGAWDSGRLYPRETQIRVPWDSICSPSPSQVAPSRRDLQGWHAEGSCVGRRGTGLVRHLRSDCDLSGLLPLGCDLALPRIRFGTRATSITRTGASLSPFKEWILRAPTG